MKDLSHLTKLQFEVTQNRGTEAPFDNEFWDFDQPGIYLDIVSEEILFSSLHKFPSPCGWPAFYKALDFNNIVLVDDHSHGLKRTEVRSKHGDSHLGHIFTDGPAPTGIRYCVNSAALKFVSLDEMKTLDEYEDLIKEFEPDKNKAVNLEGITLGAGCFWGVEAILAKTPGVISAVSGYAGGRTINPTYEDICQGNTGHAEVVQVEYDLNVISTEELLDLFFRLHDPTTLNRQGADVGTQYRSVIYTHKLEQKEIAKKLISKIQNQFPQKIVTEISDFQTFYPAEEYHQKYYDKKYQGGHGPICHYVRGV